jgi:2-amino-4-hydroxy-6-hydroxymethyldihydropteridine diphosphokinase
MADTFCTAFVGLGSNLADPQRQVQQALIALAKLPQTQLFCHSSLYRNPPLGTVRQPDYINAVAMLSTELAPVPLLRQLHKIERQQGRDRGTEVRWGPRTLDLDLLLHGETQCHTAELTLPHPGLPERAFVLYPLYECVPDLILPDGQALRVLVQHCSAEALQRL